MSALDATDPDHLTAVQRAAEALVGVVIVLLAVYGTFYELTALS